MKYSFINKRVYACDIKEFTLVEICISDISPLFN